jgi:heme-degrading monooxygenase HmoA
MKFKEMDAHVSLSDQLGQEAGPVVLVNEFSVDPRQADDLIVAWAEDAAYFKSRPGFIAAQLHRGIAGSGVFLNYAVWESVRDFRNAFSSPEFRSKLTRYPESTVASPHLFQKVAVPGICLGC